MDIGFWAAMLRAKWSGELPDNCYCHQCRQMDYQMKQAIRRKLDLMRQVETPEANATKPEAPEASIEKSEVPSPSKIEADPRTKLEQS